MDRPNRGTRHHLGTPASTNPHLAASALVLVAVAVFFAFPMAAAAEDPEPAVATLTYSEKVREEGERTKVVCSGGGLTGAMNCVTIRIENENNTTGGREITAQASLVLTLAPRLEVLSDNTHIVTITLGEADPDIVGEMKEDSAMLVRQDASQVKERLRAWKLSLNAESIAKIRSGEAVRSRCLDPSRAWRS